MTLSDERLAALRDDVYLAPTSDEISQLCREVLAARAMRDAPFCRCEGCDDDCLACIAAEAYDRARNGK